MSVQVRLLAQVKIMKLKLTTLARHEAYLRLYGILTSLPIAKDAVSEYIKLERRCTAELIKNWRQEYNIALKKIFKLIPQGEEEQGLKIITDNLYNALGPKFGQLPAVKAVFKEFIGLVYEEAKSEFVVKSSLSDFDRRAIDVLTKHNCVWAGEHYGKHVEPKITEIVRKGIENGTGRKKLAEELRDTLGGGAGEADYWDVVASSALVRSRSFGTIAGMEEAEITDYEVLAVGDERMCDICGEMNGKVFSVHETKQLIDNVLRIEDSEKFKEAMPWHTASPKGRSEADLLSSGMSLPPYHANCRCSVVVAAHDSLIAATPKLKIEVSPEQQESAEAPHKTPDKNSLKLAEREVFIKRIEEKRARLKQCQEEYKDINLSVAKRNELRKEQIRLKKELVNIKIEAADKKIIFVSKIAEILDKSDVSDIIKIIEKSPKDMRRLWNMYEDKIKIMDKFYKDTAYYDSGEGIYFDIDEDRLTTQKRTAFETLFHESGHLIDYEVMQAVHLKGWKSLSNNHAFENTIINEVNNYIDSMQEAMVNDLVKEGKTYEEARKMTSLEKAQDEVCKQLDKIPLVYRNAVSDIFDGVTIGEVNGGIGHDNEYWKENSDNLSLEAFADFNQATFCNPTEVKYIKQFLPESYKIFKSIVKEIIEEAEK